MDDQSLNIIDDTRQRLLNEGLSPQNFDQFRLKIASIYIDDAIHKRKTEKQISLSSRSLFVIQAFWFSHNSWWKRFLWIIVLVHLGLAEFERVSVRDHETSAQSQLICSLVELFCLFVYCLDFGARLITVRPRQYFANPWNSGKALCILFIFADVIVGMCTNDILRMSRVARSFLLLEKSRTVRGIVANIIKTIPKILPVGVLFLFLIVLYALWGTVMYKTIPDYPEFGSLMESFVSLFILTTTENFPDVMLPAYGVHTYYSVFFISFLLFSQLFLMNLIVATFYQHFSDHTQSSVSKALEFRKESLNKAFQLIKTQDEYITLDTFVEVMLLVKRSSSMSRDQIEFIYHMLDKDHDEQLNLEEFLYVCEVLQFTYEEVLDVGHSLYKRPFLNLLQSRLYPAVSSKYWKYAMDVIIVASTAYTIVEVAICKSKCVGLDAPEVGMSVFFFVEMCIRILVYSPKQFFRSGWNRFDSFLVTLVFVFNGIVAEFVNQGVFHYVFVLRLFLLVRIVYNTRRLHLMVSTIISLIPAISHFLVILLSIFYIYGIIGMEVYYGRLQETNPILNGNKYYLINFDSFGNAMVALYVLMTVNNWNTFMAGTVLATSKWSRIFYISFYLVSVLVVLNVIIAFVIETFVEQHDARMYREEKSAHISDAIQNEEIRERINIAVRRASGKTHWKVNPNRDLNFLFEGMVKTSIQ